MAFARPGDLHDRVLMDCLLGRRSLPAAALRFHALPCFLYLGLMNSDVMSYLRGNACGTPVNCMYMCLQMQDVCICVCVRVHMHTCVCVFVCIACT